MREHGSGAGPEAEGGGLLNGLIASEAAGGVILMFMAATAMVVANSPLAPAYFEVLHLPLGGLSVLHVVNDGLMALFFLLVGLEIKREVLEGELSSWGRRILPGVAALGGMVVPALVYLLFQRGDPMAVRGWAIASATDIAFALGVLSLLGSRVPTALKVFLAALAIIDDLGAVLIIAVFYASGISAISLAAAAGVFAALLVMNRLGVRPLKAYLALGLLLWVLMLRSGVHPTLAGVLLALAIPLRVLHPGEAPPLHRLEHALQPWVALLVVPVFGFANAGVSLAGLGPAALTAPVPLGAAAGLFLGKQAGVFGAAWLAVRLRLAALPAGVGWAQLYGVALLCGIGFTMSLFIGSLAFRSEDLREAAKLGVICGSLLSAAAGVLVLRLARTRR